MAKWIKDKVNNFFSGIVDGVKGLLGIKSPSKVFAGIGGYMAEGLGQGWSKSYSEVEDDITGKVRKTSAAAAEIGKSLEDVAYAPDVDYSALMLAATSLEEFQELATKRMAKIAGENIGLAEQGFADNGQLLEQWKESAEKSETASADAVQSMTDTIREEIESLISNAPDMGRRFVDGLSNGIIQGTSVLLQHVQNMCAELRTGFGEDLSSIQQRLDRSIADLAGSSSSTTEAVVPSASSSAGSSLSNGEMASMAAMFRDALQDASVYMNGRKVGRLITSQQLNSAMAKGV